MEWHEILLTLSSSLVGLGGLAVGILTIVLSYKERKAWIRQEVYHKQIEACDKVLKAATAVKGAVLFNTDVDMSLPLSDLERKALLEGGIGKATKDFIEAVNGVYSWLPSKVISACIEFLDVPIGLVNPESEHTAATPFDEIYDAWEGLARVMRKAMGIEPLSAETIRMLGLPKALLKQHGFENKSD